MENESKIPEVILSYAKNIAKNGHRIRWISREEVDKLRGIALEQIARYKEAKADLDRCDEEQEEAKKWLTSIGVEFKKQETCQVQ